MVDVFISYSRKDKDFVKVLHQALSRSKYETWVDWQDIPLTADWWEEIKQGIESADNFVFIISPDSIESKVCHQEVDHAARHNKRIVPVVRREGFDTVFIHEGLSRHNWLFFRSIDDFDAAFQDLVKAIDLDLPYVRTHTRLLRRAVEWEKNQRRDDLLIRGQDLQIAEQWLEESLANQQEPLVAEQHKIFIHKSREVEAASQRLLAAGERARRLVQLGSSVLTLTLIGSAVVGLLAVDAFRSLNQAQIRALLTDANTAYKANPHTLDALELSLRAAEMLQVKRLVKDREELKMQLTSTLLQGNYGIAEQDRLETHTDNVLNITSSPDGQHYVATSADRTASLWDTSGKLLKQLEGHQDWVREARYSPDGSLLATASDDGTVRLWTPEGDFIRDFAAHNDYVYSLDFSPDSKTLATASRDGTVKLWTAKGQPLEMLVVSREPVRSVRYLADGSFVTAGKDGMIRWWNGQDLPIATWEAHADEITALAASPIEDDPAEPNGQQLIASVSRDGTVRLWNLADQKLVQTLSPPVLDGGEPGELWSVTFSLDGRWIAAGGEKAQVDLWWREGSHMITLEGHEGRIRSLAWSPDHQTFMSSSEDNTVKLWRWPNPNLITLKGHEKAVSDAAVSSDGLIASASYDTNITLWNALGQPVDTLTTLKEPINTLKSGPNGTLAAAADNGQVALWSSLSEAPVIFTAHGGQDVNDIDFSPDGQLLLTASDDGTAKLWARDDVTTPLAVLNEHTGPIYSATFSPDGQHILSAGEDGTLRLWDRTGQAQQHFKISDSRLTSTQWSPNGQLLVAVGEDPSGYILTLDGVEVTRLEGHTDSLWSVAFSPDGQQIATGSNDDTVRLWNLDGEPLITLQGHHQDDIYQVRFSPDGRQLISSSRDRTARIWNITDVSLSGLIDQGCRWFATPSGESRVESLEAFCER